MDTTGAPKYWVLVYDSRFGSVFEAVSHDIEELMRLQPTIFDATIQKYSYIELTLEEWASRPQWLADVTHPRRKDILSRRRRYRRIKYEISD